jgi:hypothetical membrane protein
MSVEVFRTICGIISTVLAIFGIFPYLRSIFQGKTKPHQFSWLVFCIMNGLVFITQFLEGGRQSVLISLVFFVTTSIVFVLSLSRGSRNTSKFDKLLFAAALFTVVLWLLTKNNVLAIWLTVVIDICATAMTMLKVQVEPHSEDPTPWLVSTVAFIFTCLTLAGKPLSVLYVRPIYGLFSVGIVAWFILYHRKKGKALAHETTSLMQ